MQAMELMNIPTQALLDTYSIRERFGEVKGKNVVIVGDILTQSSSAYQIYLHYKN